MNKELNSPKKDNESEVVSTMETTEETEQIGKDIIVGRKESRYEDGKNVISVIINAISVRINMPRGTVKALLACFAALIIVALVVGLDGQGSAEPEEKADTAATETQTEPARDESKAVNAERPASDYVIISSRYRYTVPDDYAEIWEPTDYNEENETFCYFSYNDDPYSIRSYLLDYTNGGLAEIVKASLEQFEGYKYVDEGYVNGEYGQVLKVRFEETDPDGAVYYVTGYYWSDIDPHICCLEVASDAWHDDGVEASVLESVYRVNPSGDAGSNSYDIPPDAEQIWKEQQAQDARDSMAQDAMREYYYGPEQDTGFPY